MTKNELLALRYKPVSSTDSAGEHRVKMLNASLGIVKYNVYTYKANGDYYAKRWSWYYNGQLYQMYEADKLVDAINRNLVKYDKQYGSKQRITKENRPKH